MLPYGFVTTPHWSYIQSTNSSNSFLGKNINVDHSPSIVSRTTTTSQRRRVVAKLSTEGVNKVSTSSKHKRIIGIVGKKSDNVESITIDLNETFRNGIFGMKANAYWERMGALPLFFAGFGITALAIKLFKVKRGQMKDGVNGANKITLPKTAITSAEEEAELHVFKCGGCGYEMYPARGREFKFFPDSFKCPLCGKPKSEFWDLNDPDDPRNQELYEDDDTEIDPSDDNGSDDDGPSKAPSPGGVDSTVAQRDSAEQDKSA